MMKLTQLLNQSPAKELSPDEEGTPKKSGRPPSQRKTPVPAAIPLLNPKVDDDGLMTPHSSDSSPTLKTEDLLFVGQLLADMSVTDLTRTTIEKELHGYPWSAVQQIIYQYKFPEKLTRPEVEFIVRLWHNSKRVELSAIAQECFARSPESLRSRLSLLEANYGGVRRDALLVEELVALEICHHENCYHADDIVSFFPEYHYERFRKLVSAFYPHKLRWTQRELQFITDKIKQGLSHEDYELLRYLPFRRKCEVKAKYLALKRKIPTTDLPSENVEIVSEPTHVENPLFDLIENDLTMTSIKNAVPTASTILKVVCQLQEEIERRGGSEKIAFTDPERDTVRKSLEEGLSHDEIQLQLPFRTQEEIDGQVKKMQSACVRQKKFKNDIERLIYEAEWYSSMAENAATPGGRRRRVRKDSVEFETLRKEAINKKKRILEGPTEEDPEKKRLNAIKTQKRVETIRKKKEHQEELKKRRQKGKSPATPRHQLRSYKERATQMKSLLEEAKYFQSITGDGKCVKEGVKRKRVPTYHLIPEFQNRQKLKTAQKKIEEQKFRRRGRARASSETPSTEESDFDEVDKLQRAMEEDLSDDDDISPFDPPDICRDTLVPLHGRELFNDSISTGCLFPFYVSFTSDLSSMMRPGKEYPVINTVASDVIRENLKSYKSLTGSFPPLYAIGPNGESIGNSRNVIHVRYLLYPTHSEQFILAKPKSNELDPVYEINKIFQIHYALYFSHSEVLKDIIYNDYCQSLQEAVDNEDFGAFMTVIDKWNCLMLELTPYPIEINPSVDINESLRCFLPRNYNIFPSYTDLKLQQFHLEVLAAGETNINTPVKPSPLLRRVSQTLQSPKLSTKMPSNPEIAQLPDVYVSRFRHLRPILYSTAFINLLNSMTSITRYCVQQLLLRTYSRIVSPHSRKLRSYKAFSAEVYGELLPSFVSEVLSKVDLQPHHKFYDLGSGVGNTTFQAALEFGVHESGGCEIMGHASYLTSRQEIFLQKQLALLGMKELNLSFALDQSFVDNDEVRKKCVDCDVLIVNNYLFDFPLNVAVGKLLVGLRPGSKIISLRNFIPPRYKVGDDDTIFDYLTVEKFEMSDYFSVSWTANKVPYYISTVQKEVVDEYK
ncbi:hypothetical protein PUMCH_004143 [Australozyma saopauloensis]|uniref:Histone-lysine N-methyltransferase, H3 lysine-79 specific n=1 Tax=Australozyma saopauloensis TaxID=291208 RepID=A0AAX4HEV9_9ASCO|nr:hypothetical protein PUMCH_004143 [[Candida] saopauloensis]